MNRILFWQWTVLVVSFIILFFISPTTPTKEGFFRGVSRSSERPGFLLLTFSIVMTWIFAKSVTNAANLGLEFGIVGGVAYAAYYFSILVAGIVIYNMRVKGKIASIHGFLERKFGRGAIVAFSLLIAVRLLNEVWSNTEVIGTYFGKTGSPGYVAAIVAFTLLTLAYTLRGGLRTSLITDTIQMGLFAVLLFIVLRMIIPAKGSLAPFVESGHWTLSGGLDLVLVALIQVFSYPFHDPLLTDRGFIAEEKATLGSYVAATFITILLILLFSFVGIFANFLGLQGQAAVEIGRTFGAPSMIVMNFIMVTSAASTLDSTFSSVSKLVVVDLGKKERVSVSRGRWRMTLTAIGGTIPLLFSPTILSATTISGTAALGLAPIFLFWKLPAPKISFHLAIWTGFAAAAVLVFNLLPRSLYIGDGHFAGLLGINVYATALIFAMYFLPFVWTGCNIHAQSVENAQETGFVEYTRR